MANNFMWMVMGGVLAHVVPWQYKLLIKRSKRAKKVHDYIVARFS